MEARQGERIAALEAVIPRIHEDISGLRKAVERRMEQQERRMEEQGERISELERWRAGLVGMGAVIGAGASVIVKVVIDWLRGAS